MLSGMENAGGAATPTGADETNLSADNYPQPDTEMQLPSWMEAPTADLGEAERFLRILAPDGQVTFQTFDDNPRKDAGLAKIRHGTLTDNAQALTTLNNAGAGVFVMVNEGDGKGRKAANVVRVCALFGDLDGAPLEPVLAVTPKPQIIVESSPGKWHAYWLVSDCHTDHFAGLQKAIAQRFDSDPKVHDLPRVMRLPGFLHRKDNPFKTRIHQINQAAPYPTAEVVAGLGLTTLKKTQATKPLITDGECITEGGRDNALMSRAGTMREKGFDADEILAALKVVNQKRCVPPLSDAEVLRIAKSAGRYPAGSSPVGLQFPEIVAAVEADPVLNNLMVSAPTEDSVALIFERAADERLKYAADFGKWLRWDGRRWEVDDLGHASHMVREISRRANNEGKAGVASSKFASGVERFAKCAPTIATRGATFDADNYLLNTPLGTIDLRVNEIRQHSPNDRITKMTAVSPSSDGADLFRRFLSDITGGDAALQEFLQVSLGACLSGAVEGHWLLFWKGSGRNGKNTLGDLVAWAMGDYAIKISAAVLMAKKHESHPTELAQLRGVRLAVASEIAAGEHWHESRIKELTGDATISARFMHQDFFTFNRTHKHLIFGNNQPQIRSVDGAIRSRLKIVPFSQSFIGREDMTLPDRLRDQAGGYCLQWLIEGHRKWLELGRKLPECKSVNDESDDYFASQSTIEMWLDERCAVDLKDKQPASTYPTSATLYQDYAQWKRARGEHALSQSVWGEQMTAKFKRVKSNGVRYLGVRVVDWNPWNPHPVYPVCSPLL
jgi:putative DNA primase/helicase